VSRRLRITLSVASVAAIAVATPFVLRVMPFFAVRQIEVVGARFLSPERIVEAMVLEPDQNLFDPVGDAERRVLGVEGVVQAAIHRRVPGTLRVIVIEREPVGLVSSDEGMVPVDCDGSVLPYDPVAAGVALPIVARADSTLMQALCVVRASDSALYAAVDMVRGGGGGSVILDLGAQRARLRDTPSTKDVEALSLVRRHLAEAGQVFGELDARFDGLVFAKDRQS
jgi:hypothetical protein